MQRCLGILSRVARPQSVNKRTIRLHRTAAATTRGNDNLTFRDFLQNKNAVSAKDSRDVVEADESIPYVDESVYRLNRPQSVLIEIYGCQMNVNDGDLVWTFLHGAGYTKASTLADADVVLLVTCAIREGAEAKIFARLANIRAINKKAGRSTLR